MFCPSGLGVNKRVNNDFKYSSRNNPNLENCAVNKENIFEVMMVLHYRNLQASLPHFKEGEILDTDNLPLADGESAYYKGSYLVYDGEKIIEKAAQRLIRGNALRESAQITSIDDFVEKLMVKNPLSNKRKRKDADIVHLYNTTNGQLTRVKSEFSNEYKKRRSVSEMFSSALNYFSYFSKNHPQSSGKLDDLLRESLPANFVSPDSSVDAADVGSRTASAVLTAYSLNYNKDQGVKTIIIREGPYGSLGMGKLAEFGKEGLTREFFFEYAPNHQGPFIDEKHQIIGVYREYKKQSSGKPPIPVLERIVHFNPNGEWLYSDSIIKKS
jgi:hypothetical protein